MPTPQPFSGQLAILTGGADGLGRALAQKLIQNDVRVCLFDINEAKLRAAQAELGELSLH